jgi:hydrogenase/urease accessory protein HupE
MLANGQTQTVILKPASSAFSVAGTQSGWQVFNAYMVLGIEHILFGIDHLLFVLGLLLLVRGVSLLVQTITAFTLAHSLTLAIAALGFVNVPQAPVEAVIALSILFLATELIKQRQGREGLAEKYPWLVALSFGLLHGFGFAGALAEVGLPQTAIPLALFSFNVGVEIGQLLFVAVALSVIWLLKRVRVAWPAWAEFVPAYGIGSMAAFWCIQRISAF